MMHPERFKDQVMVVTGAAQGIGRGVALGAAREGAQLVLADRSALVHEVAQEAVALGAQVVVVEADLEIWAGASRMAAQALEDYGRIDILVNNVGGTIWAKPYQEYEEAQIEAEIRRSLFPTLWGCRAVLPAMLAQGAGAIVNVSSVAGLNYFPGLMAYGMAKAALEHLTVSAAHQLRPFDIAVNTFRIDVPVASEGFVFNMPDADHSDWEPSEVAAEGIVWMLEQPSSYTGRNEGMARLREDYGIMASRSERPHRPGATVVTETHLRPV